MTSENAPDTPCERCPLPAGCPLTNPDVDPARAYKRGCRSQSARDAWNERMRTYRQTYGKNDPTAGSDRSSGMSGDRSWPVPVVKREPIGATCSNCGSPVYWEPGHAGLMCENRHWFNDPKISNRIAASARIVKRTQKEPVNVRAEIELRMKLRIKREQVISECKTLARGYLNPELYPANAWQRQYAEQMRIELSALIPEIMSADTVELLTLIVQMFNDFKGRLQQYKSELDYALQIQARANQASISAKALNQSPETDENYEDNEDYDDEDYEDEDYEDDDDYEPNAVTRAIATRTNARKQRRNKNGECHFKSRHRLLMFTDSVATRWVAGIVENTRNRIGYRDFKSTPIYVCDSDKCLALANAYFLQRGFTNSMYGDIDE